jgi:hypothetical protein
MYHAREKPHRNPAVTRLVRALDAQHLAELARQPRPGRMYVYLVLSCGLFLIKSRPGPRKVDELLSASALSLRHPAPCDKEGKNAIPVDFFMPAYYNWTMTFEERASYAATNGGFAFPPPAYCPSEFIPGKAAFSLNEAVLWGHWFDAPSQTFNAIYGEDLRALYEVPTEEEIAEFEEEKRLVEEAEGDVVYDLEDSDAEDDEQSGDRGDEMSQEE